MGWALIVIWKAHVQFTIPLCLSTDSNMAEAECQPSGSEVPVTSLLDKLKSPPLSALSRKRKILSTPLPVGTDKSFHRC